MNPHRRLIEAARDVVDNYDRPSALQEAIAELEDALDEATQTGDYAPDEEEA